MNRLYTIASLLFFAPLCIGVANAQNHALPILETPTDARAAALGGQTLMTTETNDVYLNPASILYSDRKLTVGVTGYLFPKPEDEIIDGRLFQTGVSAGWHFLDRHAVHAGFRYMGGLSVPNISEEFGPEGKKKTSPFDWTIDLAYAFKLNNHFAFFATAAALQSYVTNTAYAFPFSVGATYRTGFDFRNQEAIVGAALSVADVGAPVYYTSHKGYALPSNIRLSSDVMLPFGTDHKLTCVVGGRIYFLDDPGVTAGLGAEYMYRDMVGVRLGYQYAGEDLSRITIGLGGQYAGVRLDLTYLKSLNDGLGDHLMGGVSFTF